MAKHMLKNILKFLILSVFADQVKNSSVIRIRGFSFIGIFKLSAGPNHEHSRTVLNYIHKCEGRFFMHRVRLENWPSAEAAP